MSDLDACNDRGRFYRDIDVKFGMNVFAFSLRGHYPEWRERASWMGGGRGGESWGSSGCKKSDQAPLLAPRAQRMGPAPQNSSTSYQTHVRKCNTIFTRFRSMCE